MLNKCADTFCPNLGRIAELEEGMRRLVEELAEAKDRLRSAQVPTKLQVPSPRRGLVDPRDPGHGGPRLDPERWGERGAS